MNRKIKGIAFILIILVVIMTLTYGILMIANLQQNEKERAFQRSRERSYEQECKYMLTDPLSIHRTVFDDKCLEIAGLTRTIENSTADIHKQVHIGQMELRDGIVQIILNQFEKLEDRKSVIELARPELYSMLKVGDLVSIHYKFDNQKILLKTKSGSVMAIINCKDVPDPRLPKCEKFTIIDVVRLEK